MMRILASRSPRTGNTLGHRLLFVSLAPFCAGIWAITILAVRAVLS